MRASYRVRSRPATPCVTPRVFPYTERVPVSPPEVAADAVREGRDAERRFPRPEPPRPRFLERRTRLREAEAAQRRKAAVVVPRRADHGQQPDGRPPRLGPHLQGRLQPLLRHDRPRPPLLAG